MSKTIGAAELSAVLLNKGNRKGEPRHENQQGKTTGKRLELEHALTWLLEAISQHQSGKMGGEPWHLYQTTLFAMYVDYDNGKVRLSAALACHDADLEMSLKDFVEILSREAVKEAAPLHYTPGSSGKCIHRYRNPYFKRRRRDREPDIGFYS